MVFHAARQFLSESLRGEIRRVDLPPRMIATRGKRFAFRPWPQAFGGHECRRVVRSDNRVGHREEGWAKTAAGPEPLMMYNDPEPLAAEIRSANQGIFSWRCLHREFGIATPRAARSVFAPRRPNLERLCRSMVRIGGNHTQRYMRTGRTGHERGGGNALSCVRDGRAVPDGDGELRPPLVLDRVRAAVLLQAVGHAVALCAKAGWERGPRFLHLANALSALCPREGV